MSRWGKTYFLSRPRRFGKSHFISTLEAYFLGKRELFDGLDIQPLEDTRGEDAWTMYPVILFSLSGGAYQDAEGLSKTLGLTLSDYETCYKVDKEDLDLPNRFRRLIRTMVARTSKRVVVLVDEYDKPLLETMVVDKAQEERNRRLYKAFFSVLKDEDQYLKFVFFTGVTKFSKVSVFSDLNQLNDISLTDTYAEICGITEQELCNTFRPEVDALADKLGTDRDGCLASLARMYDGYHFSPGATGVYNPFSLLNALQKRSLSSYWFETGTPTFLIRKLRASSFTPERLSDGVEVGESGLTDYRAESPNPIPLFYQTGYLTILAYDEEFRLYTLGFPNDEVRYGFLESLVPYVLGEEDAERPVSLRSMVLDLRRGDADSFLTRLQSLFAAIPYPEGGAPTYEREWRNQVFLVFSLLGQNVRCEVHSARGRADCIVETQDYVYVIEFKLDDSVEAALEQIDRRGYGRSFGADPRTVMRVGVSFSSVERNIEAWKVLRGA